MSTVFECVCAFIWQIVNIRFEWDSGVDDICCPLTSTHLIICSAKKARSSSEYSFSYYANCYLLSVKNVAWVLPFGFSLHFFFLFFPSQVIKMSLNLKRSDHNSVHYSNIQFISIHILLFKNQEYSFVLCKHRKFKLWPQAKWTNKL